MIVNMQVKFSGDNILISRASALMQRSFTKLGRRYLEDQKLTQDQILTVKIHFNSTTIFLDTTAIFE